MKILVVDDSITIRRIIVNLLRASGYNDIIEAANGREAFSIMAGVSLVLTDWNMPVMDGLSFLKVVRADSVYGKIPIIMVTAEGNQEDVLEALSCGANDYIIKPFNKTNLISKVEKFLVANQAE